MNKKIKNLILIFMLLILPLMFVSNKSLAADIILAQGNVLKGDLNNSGQIDMGDIILMLRHTSADHNKEWLLSEEKIKLADMNKNGVVDIGDIIIALRYWAATNNTDIAKKHPEWLKIEENVENKQDENKKDENKQDENKQDENKKDESKQDENKQDENKKDESKQDENKQDENKKDENKKDESKQDENKQDENKKDENKQDENKQDENKKDENKQDENKQDENKQEEIKVNEIKLENSDITVTVGKKSTLKAEVKPANAKNKIIKWTSSDSTIASVDQSGKITALKRGNVTITADATDGSGKKATCKVEVTQPVTKLTMKREKKSSKGKITLVTEKEIELTVPKGETTEKTVTLQAIATPSNANNKEVEWSTSNKNAVTVNKKGVVTAVAKGTATITAKAKDGSNVKATYKVKVKQLVTKVKLDKTKATLLVGKNIQLNPTVTPKNANNNKLEWISSKPKVATVDKNGKVTARKAGTATITAKAKDESKKYATCTVTVKEIVVSKVKLNNTSLTVNEGETKKLKATVEPQNATNQTLTWKSDKTNIVTVTDKGEVKGVAKGTAKITVTSNNGKKAECTVEVKEKVDPSVYTNLKLTATELYISAGNSYTIKTTKNIGSVSINWESGDKNIASVDKTKGIVKANKKGNTTITATIGDKKYQCKVHVLNATIEFYKSDNDGKKKLKMFLNNKQLNNALPSKEARKYDWKSKNGKIELEGKNEGRPRVKKIKDADTIIANITDKLADNASGIRIRLKAERKMAKNEKPVSEEETHKKERNAK